MTSVRHTLLALLLSCFFAAPLKARDKIHRIPPTSAGKSKIIEPDHLSLKAKAERQVMPQTEGAQFADFLCVHKSNRRGIFSRRILSTKP